MVVQLVHEEADPTTSSARNGKYRSRAERYDVGEYEPSPDILKFREYADKISKVSTETLQKRVEI